MKNAFIVSILILAATVAPSIFGMVSFRLPGLSSVIGAYAALGTLAFAFRDYTRQSRTNARPAHTRSSRASLRRAVHPLSLPHPTQHAN